MSGKASVRQKATREVIDIADKLAWTKLVSSDDDYNFDVNGLGFIGKGSTKCAIYARFEHEEYAITFPFDLSMGPSDARQMLEDEYTLLAQCHAFKTEFDNLARQFDVTPPAFYFNFARAIFGEFIPCPISNELPIPYPYFIATPLLPCGTVNGGVRKFTGNGQVGSADDDITKSAHAFVHFSLLYSLKTILFCDLQGLMDKHGVWCFFDPQAHTTTKSRDTAYWNKGRGEIEAFEQQHSEAVCDSNWVCRKLRLKHISYETDKSGGESESPPKKQARCTPALENLLG